LISSSWDSSLFSILSSLYFFLANELTCESMSLLGLRESLPNFVIYMKSECRV
jgi:hypothetical protein